MSVEIQLPDLPDISLAAPPRPAMPWYLRVRDTLSSYLPLLLMAALALGTWWLVKNTPGAPPARNADVSRGVPDYSMHRFEVQRFAPDGHLTARLEGKELRHYPESDRIEVDELHLQAFLPDGRVTTATARQAVSNGAASELELRGGAEVVGTDADGTPVTIRSEFLHAFIDTEIVLTDVPVQVRHGRSLLQAGGLRYDGQRRLIDFQGPVRASLQVPRP
jgi:lipopolysaccharide export system protein LptC